MENKFTTTIKTRYTNIPADTEKKDFISPYCSKSRKQAVSGENRNPGKKYGSRLVKR